MECYDGLQHRYGVNGMLSVVATVAEFVWLLMG
jgi:hypothetical protein